MSDFDFEQGSPLKDAATSMHELYITLKEAGFSRRDALELVSRIMMGAISEAVAESNNDEDE